MELAIGIDIGGTNTKLALVNASGDILDRRQLSTPANTSVEAYFQAIYSQIEALAASPGLSALAGIGIGAPACNERKGTIERTANLLIHEPVPIRDIFSAHFGVPVQLVKDANASAIGEWRFGGARGLSNFALLTLGTGLGCGLIINGTPVSGGSGLASELGHTTAIPHGRQCGCGRRGCLETYVSATGIRRTAFQLLAEEIADSELRGVTFAELTAHRLTEAAARGDGIARLAFERTGEILGRAIADLAAAVEPEAVFLSGGLAQAGEWILQPTREHLEREVLHLMRGRIRVLPSQLGANDAALLGSASLALYQKETKIS